jgi:hypothetical protein
LAFLTVSRPEFARAYGLQEGRDTMQTLTIAAASRESAIGLYAALEEFRRDLLESEDGYRVEIQLGRGNREIVEVLSAIALHVRERDDGPARLEMSGRTYSVYPTD